MIFSILHRFWEAPKFNCHAKTRTNDGVKYHMDIDGVTIGDVVKLNNGSSTFAASADSGDAVDMRWVDGFASRRDACLYLLGAKVERERPARFWKAHEGSPLGYTGRVTGN